MLLNDRIDYDALVEKWFDEGIHPFDVCSYVGHLPIEYLHLAFHSPVSIFDFSNICRHFWTKVLHILLDYVQ